MIYCTKCGAKNENKAEICAKCGALLFHPERTGRRPLSGEGRLYLRGRRAPSFWGVFFGLLFILVGVLWLLSEFFPLITWEGLWPLIMMLFGAAIIVRVLIRR